jgi:hypothetical protein
MSSRQEEKERRRREREEAERAAAASAARRKRLGLALGGALAVAVAVIVVLAVASGGDSDVVDREGAGEPAAIPARQITNLNEAAEAAGCEIGRHREEGRQHTEGEDIEYGTNPPTSGPHHPTPSEDGIYDRENPPQLTQSVHSLEHGRILIQYQEGTPASRVAQLETLFNEEVRGTRGYKTLLFQNQTEMEAAVAATSWTRSLTCPEFNDRVFDAIRAFREQNVDQAPEFIP